MRIEDLISAMSNNPKANQAPELCEKRYQFYNSPFVPENKEFVGFRSRVSPEGSTRVLVPVDNDKEIQDRLRNLDRCKKPAWSMHSK